MQTQTMQIKKPELPSGLKYCFENPFRASMTLKVYQEILYDIFGAKNLTKSVVTEKYSGKNGTDSHLVLFYYKGTHIATYNKDTKMTCSFYE